MKNDRHFTDEELTAYLDGEGDHAPIVEIEQALIVDDLLQKRLKALTLDTSLISRSFAAVAPPAHETEKLRGVSKKPHSFSWLSIAASVVLAVLVGFGFGSWSVPDNNRDWRNYVASYQALYSNDTLSHVDRTDEEMITELARVSSAIGKDVQLADLTFNSRAEYKRGQILSFEGKTIIQLAFLSDKGEPIALCILQSDTASKMTLSYSSMESMSSASWSNGGYEYLLIGSEDTKLISDLASRFAKAI